MKIDTHTHTSGISLCSAVDYKEAADLYIRAGYDGIVLTNHYNGGQLFSYGVSAKKFAVMFVDEYLKMRDYAGSRMRVFLGAEVALDLPDCHYAEFLLFGTDENFFKENPDIHSLSQRGLYELCKEYGAAVIQSHPYRVQHGHFPHEPEFMDGVEINCHPHFLREEQRVREFAKEHGLTVTCGSDFHYASQAGSAGMVFDESIKDNNSLACAILSGKGEIFYR